VVEGGGLPGGGVKKKGRWDYIKEGKTRIKNGLNRGSI